MNPDNLPTLMLGPDEFDLLVWNVSNEVINGFRVDRFQETIGTSEDNFKIISKRLRSTPAGDVAPIMPDEVRVFRNALAITLEELGEDEFSTRTGHEFERGHVLLGELDQFLDRAVT